MPSKQPLPPLGAPFVVDTIVPQQFDGWREMAIDENGLLMASSADRSQEYRLTLEQAQNIMPEQEFKVTEEDGKRRVWTR